MSEDRGVLRIGEVARRTGVAVPTLRAWERRYGLLDPDRTDGGHRLYSEADIARVQAMSRLLEDGWSAAAAARQVLREPATVTPLRAVTGSGAGEGGAMAMIDRLTSAIERFDAAEADLAVDDVFVRLEVPTALDEVLLPVLRHVGDGWQDDARVIAREHFATNTLRPRLQRLLRVGATSRRTCLAAAPEGEEHDLGLLASAVVAAHAGWRVHYLGARTPTAVIEQSVVDLAPQVVLVGAVFRTHALAFLDDRPSLGRCGVVLGGEGFVGEDVERLPTAVLHDGPIRDTPASMERALEARDSGQPPAADDRATP
jgi:MerR family transcriptional regulator, light-induced transcriptional regulator